MVEMGSGEALVADTCAVVEIVAVPVSTGTGRLDGACEGLCSLQ